MIDLHMHSTFSDGSKTPQQLAQLASDAGLYAVALTDHDTVNGVASFLAACAEVGVKGIPGVEVSADFRYGTMHILGYGVHRSDGTLIEHLQWIRNGREARNEEMLYLIQKQGMHLTWQHVMDEAGEDVIGRVHFAKAMVKAGYVATSKEAFDRFLTKGRPCYAPRRKLLPADCIQLIHNAGGAAVLAHPCTIDLAPASLRAQIGELVDAGLAGIEVLYPNHDNKMIRRLRRIVKSFRLFETGGTDYHGDATPGIYMGVGAGSMAVPDALAERFL